MLTKEMLDTVENLVNTINVSEDDTLIDESLNTLFLIVKDCYHLMTHTNYPGTSNIIVLQIRAYLLNNHNRFGLSFFKQFLEPIFGCRKITNLEFLDLIVIFSFYFNRETMMPDHDMSKYHLDILQAAFINNDIKFFDYLKDANINLLLSELGKLPLFYLMFNMYSDKINNVWKYLIINNYDLTPFNNTNWIPNLISDINIFRLLLENNYKFDNSIYEYLNNEEQLKLFIEFGYDINFNNCYLFYKNCTRYQFDFCLILLKYGANPKLIQSETSKSYLELKEKLLELDIDIGDIKLGNFIC